MQQVQDIRLVYPIIAALVLLIAFLSSPVRADDGMFPAAPAARAAIDFDGRGFLLHGKREFIISGSMHYGRVPRALWRDRLLRIRAAGFNCVETYALWNLHEPQEGKWDFSGDRDLEAYLKLIHELGMYAIVRVGPYVCAEWDSGGYPVWLRFKPGIRVREDNPPFEAAVDRWYEMVMPIVARQQIHRGGAVIMVQLENEHPRGWGREMPDGYFRRLRDKAVALGLEVPYFFSGLHHGSDPAGGRPWDSAGRTNPWFSTEFWPGWYDLYGPLNQSRYTAFVRGTWKIIAYGGNGYNFYMLHGGTNFDFTNDDEVTASYDYGAAIGQAGDLRPIYFAFKQAALFARSFPAVLEDSANSTVARERAASSPAIRVTARKSAAGEILFLDNPTDAPVETSLDVGDVAAFPARPMTISPHEIRPVVLDCQVAPGVTLHRCSARILGAARHGDTTTIVLFGTPGRGVGVESIDTQERPEAAAEITFDAPSGGLAVPLQREGDGTQKPGRSDAVDRPAFDTARAGAATTRVRLTLPIPQPSAVSPIVEASFRSGGERIRVIAMPYEMAQRTWFVGPAGKTYVVTGPEYVSGIEERAGRLVVHAESTAQHGYSSAVFARQYPMTVFGSGGSATPLQIADAAARALLNRPRGEYRSPFGAAFEPPALGDWQELPATAEASTDYFAGRWKFGLNPVPMGADGDTSGYAWYRAALRAPRAGNFALAFSDAGDWLTVFVNGTRVGSSATKQRFDRPTPRTIAVPLRAGENTIAVLAAHYGRHKLFNYLGPIDAIDAKGIAGPVTLARDAGASTPVVQWRWRPASASDAALAAAPAHTDASAAGWSDAVIGQDVFRKRRGFAWFYAALPAAAGPHRRLQFDGVDDNATVFLNGKRLAYHKGWNDPFAVKLDAAWSEKGPNELLVLVENTDNTGGIVGPVTLESNSAEDGAPVLGWRERGGIDIPANGGAWRALQSGRGLGVPALFRAEFDYMPQATPGPVPILRFAPRGLTRGFAVLNGHNLGRYPEKTRAPGIYLPECWLKPGANTLIVFDEEGASPIQAALLIEDEACRLSLDLVPAPRP
ncbi:MAG TPA: beta-galactosidase [Chthonomonadaceae bacterium]|nr:beta-galactosidase [Chthonomonadaceae bacterium]